MESFAIHYEDAPLFRAGRLHFPLNWSWYLMLHRNDDCPYSFDFKNVSASVSERSRRESRGCWKGSDPG